MFKTVDFYLGIFLVLSGFAISLLNLQSILKGKNKFSRILLSENLLLICIGLAFIFRAVYSLDPYNINMGDVEEIMSRNLEHYETFQCGFPSLFISYGPLILSLVNSFISLIIDNYMHYQIMVDVKVKEDENTVEDLRENTNSESGRKIKFNNILTFFKTNFSFITIILQWLAPIIMTLFLYPMNVTEVSMSEMRDLHDNCIAMLDLTGNKECIPNKTLPIHKYISSPMNYTKTYDYEYNSNKTTEIDSVLNNVFQVLSKYNNNSDFFFTQISKSARTPKFSDNCMKICFTDNKSVLLYMVLLTFISFFVPITISTVILTKIHMLNVKKAKHKTYVTKEVLYNILFWSPVMLDTLLSLILCSFSMQSTRTSVFSAVANIYQVIKNFLNTQHFKQNLIVPV